MINKFFAFYKNVFPVTTIIQALLLLTIIFLGFSAENGSYYIFLNTNTGFISTFNYDYPFYESNGAIILLIHVILIGIYLYNNYNFFKSNGENYKRIGFLGLFTYSILIGLYIYYLVDWKDYWIGTESENSVSASARFTNSTGELLFYFWLASLLFFFFPLIVNILLSTSSKAHELSNQVEVKNHPTPTNSDKLIELKRLLDAGIIDKKTFKEKAKPYLDQL